MRGDPAAHAAARARVRLTLGDAGAPRLRGRRARPLPGLRDVPVEALLPAADRTLLARILDTTAAIAHGHEIAAVIDGPGRAALSDALGEPVRRTAIAHRRHGASSPDGVVSDASVLVERIAASRAEARALWSWNLPPAIATRVPALAARVENPERLAVCLAVATGIVMGGAADG